MNARQDRGLEVVALQDSLGREVAARLTRLDEVDPAAIRRPRRLRIAARLRELTSGVAGLDPEVARLDILEGTLDLDRGVDVRRSARRRSLARWHVAATPDRGWTPQERHPAAEREERHDRDD